MPDNSQEHNSLDEMRTRTGGSSFYDYSFSESPDEVQVSAPRPITERNTERNSTAVAQNEGYDAFGGQGVPHNDLTCQDIGIPTTVPPPPRRRRAAVRADRRIQTGLAAEERHTDKEEKSDDESIGKCYSRKCFIGDNQHSTMRTRLVAWQQNIAVGTNRTLDIRLNEDVMDATGKKLRLKNYVWTLKLAPQKGHLHWNNMIKDLKLRIGDVVTFTKDSNDSRPNQINVSIQRGPRTISDTTAHDGGASGSGAIAKRRSAGNRNAGAGALKRQNTAAAAAPVVEPPVAMQQVQHVAVPLPPSPISVAPAPPPAPSPIYVAPAPQPAVPLLHLSPPQPQTTPLAPVATTSIDKGKKRHATLSAVNAILKTWNVPRHIRTDYAQLMCQRFISEDDELVEELLEHLDGLVEQGPTEAEFHAAVKVYLNALFRK